MSSDNRSGTCGTGKVRYADEEQAGIALDRVREARAERPDGKPPERQAYACQWCAGWHLSSKSPELDPPEPTKRDGETWEAYARRLERRIKYQRDQLESLNALRADAANRSERKRIEGLLRALGRMTENYEREKEAAYLAAVGLCAVAAAHDTKTGPAVPTQRTEGLRDSAPHGLSRGRLSPYWTAERKLVAALKVQGRLGAQLRRAWAENRQLKTRLRTFTSARTLQSVGGSPLELNFLCIHGGEADWDGTDNATHDTYFGGLQMDHAFMAAYGPEFLQAWGTADHWPVSVQIAVAIRAYLSGRGFYPWPRTARACGLIR